jgi:uncharacterized membrane protein YfcA
MRPIVHPSARHTVNRRSFHDSASPALLLLIGLTAGIAAGLFGIGGGVLIVPALVYLAGFPLHTAVGTSLAILLPRWTGRRSDLLPVRTG